MAGDGTLPEPVREDLARRLRRIEGQTKGIQRMLEEGRDCREILVQLASVRAATQSVSAQVLRHQIRECLEPAGQGAHGLSLDELISLMLRT